MRLGTAHINHKSNNVNKNDDNDDDDGDDDGDVFYLTQHCLLKGNFTKTGNIFCGALDLKGEK